MAGRIRTLARTRRIPISHLADLAGVSRRQLFDVLGGRSSPTLTWLGKVADALEVDVTELLTRPRRAS